MLVSVEAYQFWGAKPIDYQELIDYLLFLKCISFTTLKKNNYQVHLCPIAKHTGLYEQLDSIRPIMNACGQAGR